MALGKRREEQQEMWVATTNLPKSVGHIFYRKLNRLLAEADFDHTVEQMCEPYYHRRLGRPSIPAGVYFRILQPQRSACRRNSCGGYRATRSKSARCSIDSNGRRSNLCWSNLPAAVAERYPGPRSRRPGRNVDQAATPFAAAPEFCSVSPCVHVRVVGEAEDFVGI